MEEATLNSAIFTNFISGEQTVAVRLVLSRKPEEIKVNKCRGCGRTLDIKNDPDQYLGMSDIGCRDDLVLQEGKNQAWCTEKLRYV